jgi:nucleoid-associated protein YgaU
VQPEETDGEQAGVQPEETDGEQAGVQPEETGEEAGAQPEETGEEAGVQPEETGEELAGVLPEESNEEPGADAVSALPEGCVLYTVQPGDTLSSICVGLYGSHEQMENICALNGLEDPNLISEGQNLIVPAYELSQEQENAGEELVQEPVE